MPGNIMENRYEKRVSKRSFIKGRAEDFVLLPMAEARRRHGRLFLQMQRFRRREENRLIVDDFVAEGLESKEQQKREGKAGGGKGKLPKSSCEPQNSGLEKELTGEKQPAQGGRKQGPVAAVDDDRQRSSPGKGRHYDRNRRKERKDLQVAERHKKSRFRRSGFERRMQNL